MLIRNKTSRVIVYNGLTLNPGLNEATAEQVKANKSYLDADEKAGNIEEEKAGKKKKSPSTEEE